MRWQGLGRHIGVASKGKSGGQSMHTFAWQKQQAASGQFGLPFDKPEKPMRGAEGGRGRARCGKTKPRRRPGRMASTNTQGTWQTPRGRCLGTVLGKLAPNALVFGVRARAIVVPLCSRLGSGREREATSPAAKTNLLRKAKVVCGVGTVA